GVTREEADKIAAARHDLLEKELAEARTSDADTTDHSDKSRVWVGFRGGLDKDTPDFETGVPHHRLTKLLDKLAELPENFFLHPKLARYIKGRREMAVGARPLDWSAAEALAFATLAT